MKEVLGSLIKKMLEDIKKEKVSIEKAAVELAKP